MIKVQINMQYFINDYLLKKYYILMTKKREMITVSCYDEPLISRSESRGKNYKF